MCNWVILLKIRQNILMVITLLQTMEDADTNRMKVRDMLGFCLEEMMLRKKVKVPQVVKETVLRCVNYYSQSMCC
jgi:hypothetical protein